MFQLNVAHNCTVDETWLDWFASEMKDFSSLKRGRINCTGGENSAIGWRDHCIHDEYRNLLQRSSRGVNKDNPQPSNSQIDYRDGQKQKVTHAFYSSNMNASDYFLLSLLGKTSRRQTIC
uniref:Uncharacterized protein n=1 Tax=Glossina pallidipes TaxID=7398 RepID=A0A1B0A9U5_GLOPL